MLVYRLAWWVGLVVLCLGVIVVCWMLIFTVLLWVVVLFIRVFGF